MVSHARAQRLVYLRRYAGKLAYELELHGAGDVGATQLAERYAELLGGALGDRVADRDLPRRRRSRVLLRLLPASVGARDPSALATCASGSGRRGSSQLEAGDVLRGLWRDGQRLDAEELLEELTGERLDFGVVLDDLGLR